MSKCVWQRTVLNCRMLCDVGDVVQLVSVSFDSYLMFAVFTNKNTTCKEQDLSFVTVFSVVDSKPATSLWTYSNTSGSKSRSWGQPSSIPSPPFPLSLHFPPLPLPISFPPLLFLSFPSSPLLFPPLSPATVLGEHCKLPQRGPGRSPRCERITKTRLMATD